MQRFGIGSYGSPLYLSLSVIVLDRLSLSSFIMFRGKST